MRNSQTTAQMSGFLLEKAIYLLTTLLHFVTLRVHNNHIDY